MFIVVYLKDVKAHTVIQEQFVLGLVEKNLKNYGCNTNQIRRIYFSKVWLQNQIDKVNLDQNFVPNFNLPATKVYPLPNNVTETVFLAYLKKFEGM